MEWIDVNDRLPDLHDDVWEDGDEVVHYKVSDPVLCVYNGGEQTVAVYEIDGDVDFSGWVNCHDSSGLHTDLKDCRNELCLKCGDYKQRHLGACDGCRWK